MWPPCTKHWGVVLVMTNVDSDDDARGHVEDDAYVFFGWSSG